MKTLLCVVAVISALSLFVLTEGIVLQTRCCECGSLMPVDAPSGALPQKLASPFKIIVQEDDYSLNKDVHVNLTSENVNKFQSFMLVAYKKGDTSKVARGRLTLLNKDYQVRKDCISQQDTGKAFALISQETIPVRNLGFLWRPLDTYGDIEFRATFLKNDQEFWVSEKSRPIRDASKGIWPSHKAISPINTEDCGSKKGCFREPEGCIEPRCMFILTWTSTARDILFELGGLSNGAHDRYVAAAMSDDIYVGGDTVFVCAHDSAYNSTEVYIGTHNDNYETDIKKKYEKAFIDGEEVRAVNNYILHMISEEGSHDKHRLRCRFRVRRDLQNLDSNFRQLRAGPVHVIMSNGYANGGKPKPLGVGHDEYPHISAEKVDFTDFPDADGRATYPLVKAHGCLMILAWVLFSSVGFLLAKYYQPMWPEKRMYERKYWFMGHFNCMTMVFIIVVISVILIFIEGDGYTKANDLPYKAHPILGIIILICVLILPFIGLMRPAPGSECRTVFNWLYWIFATIANVLAIPNIFIGMDFGKSMVPWWATWILVFWVIFHIVVEIILEVHQCMTHKKNKERRKKHELMKRDYPKQHHPKPEPAGRRFKRFMLMLHLAVTILIVLIMIIIIAVSS